MATFYVHMLIDFSSIVTRGSNIVFSVHAEIVHPLHKQFQLLPCHLSGCEGNLVSAVADGIDFLYTLYEGGCSYSTINTARTALSTVVFLPEGHSFGHHPLVKRLSKGLFEPRPTMPDYQDMWNIYDVLQCIKSMGHNE